MGRKRFRLGKGVFELVGMGNDVGVELDKLGFLVGRTEAEVVGVGLMVVICSG